MSAAYANPPPLPLYHDRIPPFATPYQVTRGNSRSRTPPALPASLTP